MVAKKKKSLALAVCLFVLLVTLIPGTVRAADDDVDWNKGVLAYLVVDAGDAQTVIGSADTIHFRLYDLNGDPYSGSVSGYITDPDDEVTYVSISGGQGSYSIANFNFDKLGSYSIFLWDQYDNYAGGTVKVVEPVITLTGKPVVHSESKVSVKIADPDGRVLARQSITVDGTEVGAGSSSYTTLFDGTFTFTITPKKTGTVSIIYGGHVVGTVEVMPAYTPGSRIGAQAADNMQLSVEVAQSGWAKASAVILTRDDVVADAMVAVPLSKKYDAPILMTPSQSLSNEVLHEILNLGAETVYMIGGTGAISAEIESELQTFGITTQRLAGANRYDTAAQIAELVGPSDRVYLAYGYGEPDAIAVSAFAAAQGASILLTDTHSLPEETQSRLKQISPGEVVMIGGTGIISSAVETQLSGQYAVKRWGGADRYGTQQIIFQNLLTHEIPVYIASSLVSPQDAVQGKPKGDALLAAALAAKVGGCVMSVPQDSLPAAVSYSLLYNKGYISEATVVGNSESVQATLEYQIHELVKH